MTRADRERTELVEREAAVRELAVHLLDPVQLGVLVAGRGDTDGGFAHGGWSVPFFDPEAMGPVMVEVMASTEAMLMGRRTWEKAAAAWPSRTGDPFSDRINAIPKYVASRTLTEADLTWSGSVLLPADDAIGAVRELRAREGKGLQVLGSTSVAAQLVEDDLVDEYRMIEPILLGGGKRVFPDSGHARPLELVSTTTTGTGFIICTYRPAGR